MGAMLGATALALVRPHLIRLIVDRVLIEGNMSELPLLAAGIIGFGLAGAAFRYMKGYIGHIFGARAVFRLRNALYDKLQDLSFNFYDTARTGDLMARVAGDAEVFRQFIAVGAANLLEFVFVLGLGLFFMFSLSWELALLSMVTMPLVAWSVLRFEGNVRPAYHGVREAFSNLTTVVQESITGVRTMKSFAREPFAVTQFLEKNGEFEQKNEAAAALRARYFPTMEFLGHLSVVLLLGAGGWLAMVGRLTVGELIAAYSLMHLIIAPMQNLGNLLNNYVQSGTAGERLQELLEVPVRVREPENAVALRDPSGHVQFEGVTLKYPDGSHVLHGIDLDAPPGKVIGILGRTGSGKSSMVGLIPRFYDVAGGSVTVDGHDVRSLTLQSLRRAIAIVQQETFLFSATLRENIRYARRTASEEEVVRAAKLAQAWEFIAELPQGLDTVVGERGLGLSGGQRQRIAVARAILADPAVLILDDATAALDMETERLLQEAFRNAMTGRTTFIIAHRISAVRHSDEILVLEEGRVLQRGTHEELLRAEGPYKRLYEVQYGDRSVAMNPGAGRRQAGHAASRERSAGNEAGRKAAGQGEVLQ